MIRPFKSKPLFIATSFCLLLLAFPLIIFANGETIKTVVIDAGHGGKDPGAIGAGKTREKDVALGVAMKFGKLISENLKDVRVIYTRTEDVFIELHERAEFANRHKADLFIAIHINSSKNNGVKGSSTYVLGLHRTEANLEVAKRENAVIELEDNREQNYDFDPNTPEGHIIMSMKQNAFLDQSISLASKIEEQQENSAESRNSLGVKQAGFYVLYKTVMPSILTEIGFISNSWEEKYLASEAGQTTIAQNLYKAFVKYKNEMEGRPSVETVQLQEEKKAEPEVKQQEPVPVKKDTVVVVKKEEPTPQRAPVAEEKKPEPQPARKDTAVVVKKEEPAPQKPVVAEKKTEPQKGVATEEKKPEPAVVKKDSAVTTEKKADSAPVKRDSTTVVKKEEPKPAPVEKKADTAVLFPAKPEAKAVVAEKKPEPAVAADAVVFRVQLCALSKRSAAINNLKLTEGKVVTEQIPNGPIRFMAGEFSSYAKAAAQLAGIKAQGFTDAFVIAYKNGIRLSLPETAKLK